MVYHGCTRGVPLITKHYQNTSIAFSRAKPLFVYSPVYIVYSISLISTFTMVRSKINDLVEAEQLLP